MPDGGVLAIVRDKAEAANVQKEGRYDAVYSVVEVGRIIQQWRAGEAGRLAESVKDVFAGAEIVEIKRREPTEGERVLNDEIPF